MHKKDTIVIANIWENFWLKYFKWWNELIIVKKILTCLTVAALTGISAQIRIQLTFTPVHITAQVFTVLLSGSLLGPYGGLSQLLYVFLGVFGIPWFAGFKSGFPTVTGGYLIGFIFASSFIGYFTYKHKLFRTFPLQLLLMTIAIMIIYLFGAIQFSFVMKTSTLETFRLAIAPFIGVDLLKALIAAFIATSITKNINTTIESKR